MESLNFFSESELHICFSLQLELKFSIGLDMDRKNLLLVKHYNSQTKSRFFCILFFKIFNDSVFETALKFLLNNAKLY